MTTPSILTTEQMDGRVHNFYYVMEGVRSSVKKVSLHRVSSWWVKAYQSLVLTSIEAFLAAAAILSGMPVALHPENLAPTSVLALLPPLAVIGWGVGLMVGGVLTLIGIMGPILRIERAGVFLLGTTAAVYGMAVVFQTQAARTLVSGVVFTMFALAMYARYWVLGRVIGIIKDVRSTEG